IMTGSLMTVLSLPAMALPNLAQLKALNAKFTPVELKVDYSKLSPTDVKALHEILAAAHLMDDIYLRQRWSGNLVLQAKLSKLTTPLGKAQYQTFENAKGPWLPLSGEAFVAEVPAKMPPGAGFYPEDMTKAEFETWVAKLSTKQQ